mgnify:CR=1 FL=1
MSRKRGASLLEAMLVLALGSFFSLITVAALNNTLKVYNNTAGRDTALRELNKARRMLERDLNQASSAHLAIAPSPASLGGGADGDSLNFLSAVNATSGEIAVLQDGSGNPYFFQNLIYYLTVPTTHTSCLGANEGGYDYNCPHKILIRALENENPAYDFTTMDELISPLTPLLTRPAGYPNTLARDTVAINLLSFRVAQVGDALEVDLRAVSLADAQRRLAIGHTSLRTSSYTLQYRFSAYPRN